MKTLPILASLLLSLATAAAMANTAATAPAAAASAAPAAAAAPATPAANAKGQQAAEADPDRKVCKQERPVGSLIPTRICKTAAQWELEREISRKTMQDLQQRTGSTSGR